jgi:4-amino-4-deoxy-L-arabinose transferase-like glycosyltransferase
MRGKQATRRILPLLIVLLAFGVRLWRLETVPPGWSDDELSNIFVISQKIFQGDTSVYYTDATGLEALYHVISGLMLKLFGFNVVGIRLLSAFLGTLTVPLTYRVGRRLFNRQVGLLAAAALAVSFWSLVYSRVSLRHISLPIFVLLTVAFFWRGIENSRQRAASEEESIFTRHSPVFNFLLAGLFMGIGFYTYFASRGVPLILLAFMAYLWLFDRWRLRRSWPASLLPFALALLLAIPLILALKQQPSADARVTEVAVPLKEAGNGNFEPLRRHVRVTLNMFHADGDDEYLYNIPHRPVFGPAGAIFFWSGVIVALYLALQPAGRALYARLTHAPYRKPRASPSSAHSAAAAFLLLWWAAGITPGFLSVPPASLGHTIVAQPATYILGALPLLLLRRWRRGALRPATIAGLLLLTSVAGRDLPDYFYTWPQRGLVRFLYHADVKDVAQFLSHNPQIRDFAISGTLAGPWERLALEVDLKNAGVTEAEPRWYRPQRAIFLALEGEEALAFSGYPEGEALYGNLYEPVRKAGAGNYRLVRSTETAPSAANSTCFRNGLCLLSAHFNAADGRLDLTWRVDGPLDLPAMPLYSKPTTPGV